MYRPSPFSADDPERIKTFMRRYPFAMLIGQDAGKIAATQVPMLLEERDGQLILRGHVTKQTDHHQALERNPEALALFSGPHCYISSGWYQQRGMAATWNYQSVQARGTVRLLGTAETLQLLKELTHHFEAGRAQPELVEHMSEAYLQMHLKAISGFELTITALEATFKLSQNRDDESFRNIVRQLNRTDDGNAHQIAALMQQDRPHLFE